SSPPRSPPAQAACSATVKDRAKSKDLIGGTTMMVGLTSAMRGLATNKLRSFLTMLGVIFGVAAVIVAVALGQGSRDASIRRFEKLGTTTLSVFPGRQSSKGVSFGSVSTLKMADVPFILRGCPSVKAVSPEKSNFEQVKYGDKNTN